MAPSNQKRNIKTKQIEDKLNSSITKSFFKLEDEAASCNQNSSNKINDESNALLREFRSLLSNNTTGWRKQDSRDTLIIAAAKLRKLNRHSNFRNRIECAKLNEKRLKVEEQYLSLQNITNEIAHLRKNIETCLEFLPLDSDIELINIEEYKANNNQEKEIKTDPHQLHLARLNHELNERKSMLANLQELEGRKSALLSDIRGKEQRLCQIQPKIGSIKKTTVPLLDLLGIKTKQKTAARKRKFGQKLLELKRIFVNEEVCREIFGTNSIELGSDTRVEIIEEKIKIMAPSNQRRNVKTKQIEDKLNSSITKSFFKLEDEAASCNQNSSNKINDESNALLREFRSLLSNNTTGWRKQDSRDTLIIAAAKLRKLNRHSNYRNRIEGAKLNEKRLKVEEQYLSLQNITNEIAHLRRNIEACLEFMPLESDIELINIEEFKANINQGVEIKSDPHQLHLARLNHELTTRKNLVEKIQELEREKKSLLTTINTMERTIIKVDPRVSNLKKIAKPLLEIVGLKSVTLSLHNKEIPFRPVAIEDETYREIFGEKDIGGQRMGIEGNLDEDEMDEWEKEMEFYLTNTEDL